VSLVGLVANSSAVLTLLLLLLLCRCGMVKRAPHSSMVQQGWVSKPVNVSRQTWMVGPEYSWYMRCSCIKVNRGG
jgi:hypothetical protein